METRPVSTTEKTARLIYVMALSALDSPKVVPERRQEATELRDAILAAWPELEKLRLVRGK